MTKKHFIAIAKRMADHRFNLSKISDKATRDASLNVLDDTIRDLAITFQEVNPNFDYNRFAHACGLPV